MKHNVAVCVGMNNQKLFDVFFYFLNYLLNETSFVLLKESELRFFISALQYINFVLHSL